jgi:perosamine synthetase
VTTIPDKLAIEGGTPVRAELLPYGRQTIDADDIAAVTEVLRSDWLTTGPAVDEFEAAFAEAVGAQHAVAVSSGTAALHAAAFALGIGPGDEVVVPAITFAATANCVVYQGGTPVFADISPDTLLIDPSSVELLVGERTRALIAVDYAGQPCDYEALRSITDHHGLELAADACHAPGGSDRGNPVGTLADLNTFSFHPVKHIATGEGGMITTRRLDLAEKMRVFRNHGITTDHRQRAERGGHFYEMVALGYNYRLTDIQCALGLSQLRHLEAWTARRREIAARYTDAFAGIEGVDPLAVRPEADHAYHLFVIRLTDERLAARRDEIFAALRAEGIGVNVHYIPVHLHPFYRERFGTGPGLCPNAEDAYGKILSLPMFPAMNERDIDDVITAVEKVCTAFKNK